mmetsp:Transcript_46889/g.87057  ORF Transcript_46889/g.87057 Transcript_46889/m.87057 type:complete len:96 (+) Transcript_46889:1324-1611(+)
MVEVPSARVKNKHNEIQIIILCCIFVISSFKLNCQPCRSYAAVIAKTSKKETANIKVFGMSREQSVQSMYMDRKNEYIKQRKRKRANMPYMSVCM